MWAQSRAVRNKEPPWESFEDKYPQSMENSAKKKKKITHSHSHPQQEIKSMCYSKEARLNTGEKALSQ